jgi:hypothetical protein
MNGTADSFDSPVELGDIHLERMRADSNASVRYNDGVGKIRVEKSHVTF